MNNQPQLYEQDSLLMQDGAINPADLHEPYDDIEVNAVGAGVIVSMVFEGVRDAVDRRCTRFRITVIVFLLLLASLYWNVGYEMQKVKLELDLANVEDRWSQQESKFKEMKNIQGKVINELIRSKNGNKKIQTLPKVLWLYTQFKFQGEKMLQQILGNFIIQTAKNSNFQIRMVNSWSAYNYLTNQTKNKVTNTMQRTQIEESVNDILRLALLIDNGGIMIRVVEVIPVETFNWLTQYFSLSGDGYSNGQVLLFQEEQMYQDYFIAAVKGSQLLVDVFQSICRTITTGQPELYLLQKAMYKNKAMNSTKIKDMAKNIINSWLIIMTPKYYRTIIINKDTQLFKKQECQKQLMINIKLSKQKYDQKCGKPQHLIYLEEQKYRQVLQNQLQDEIDRQELKADPDSYWQLLMKIQPNKKIYQPLPPRNIHYCILDTHQTHSITAIKASFEALENQSYKQWTAVYFIDDHTDQMVQYTQTLKNDNLKLVKSRGSIGHNYEKGIIKHCPDKSFILVLRKQQRLDNQQTLQHLIPVIQPRNILGAFVGLNVQGQIKNVVNDYQEYTKLMFNGAYPKYNDLTIILNHLRVFHSDCYKLIPQFSLRTPQGVYFQDRFIFLQIFISMVINTTKKHDNTEIPHTQKIKWLIKSSSHIFDVPLKIALHDLTIKTPIWDNIIKKEIVINNFKTDAFPMTVNMDHLLQNGQTMSQFAIFNPANDYQPYTQRDKPALIPKIIHQIWIGGKIPKAKQIVIDSNMKLYPDFQLKIWKKDNITRQNFPLSYDLLQTLYDIDNFTRFSRRATMADVMRHEILYREGGFYMDTSMMLFNSVFYSWRSYKAVLGAQRVFRHRWSQSMCFFGVMPKFPGLLRIISHNNTNRYNIYLQDAVMIAGPNDFHLLIQGEEQYDPDILLMQYASFYPLTYNFRSYFECYCAIERKYLNSKDRGMFRVGGKVIIKDCGKYYPYSFGKELNTIGSSWQLPKS